MTVKSDLAVARSAQARPIQEIGAKLGIPTDQLLQYGPDKAKLSYDFIKSLNDTSDGKLILVTAMTPTMAGEGKTTTAIGLGDGLNTIGKQTIICLREPSLGPCFGMKGGAAGGGYAQVIPMEDINLHFTGDFHAVTTAHNLLAAMTDNHLYWDNEPQLDPRRITWHRVLDMNDRALRNIVHSLGNIANCYPRQDNFDITAASEIMAILCLATNLNDLERRLGNIVIGQTRNGKHVTARDIKASGAMTVLLKDAFMPNLVQTLENNPAFIHGGPFANIAHGCNSVLSTRTALKLADYVVTEAGFGADLGAEKFFNIKCRKSELKPDVAVIVATVQALKMHGKIAKNNLDRENIGAVREGYANLAQHIANVQKFGIPTVIAINKFITDTDAEINTIREMVKELNVEAIICNHWSEGGRGAIDLAKQVMKLCDANTANFQPLYEDNMTIWDKVESIAKNIYGADGISAGKNVQKQIEELQTSGYGQFPVCIAKTQYSFSTNPALKGAPTNHTVAIREVRLAAGAEFIVVITGDVMTMPGLPHTPAANDIGIDKQGYIKGLF